MKLINKTKIILFLSILFLLTTSSKVSAASVGVSPGGIYNEYLKPGLEYEQEFIISRGTPIRSVLAEIYLEANEFEDWVKFTPGKIITLPAGVQRVPFTVKLDIPEDAKYGKYEGFFRVLLKNEDRGQVSIQPAIRLDMKFYLTEKEVRLLDPQNVSVQDTYEVYPLIVELLIRNNGNSPASPDSLNLDVYSLDDKLVKTFSTYNIPKIPPFKTNTVEVIFNRHNLSPGTYLGRLKVNDQGETLLEDSSIFNVYEGGDIDLSDLPETGDVRSFLRKVWDLFLTFLRNSFKYISAFVLEYKYYLIGGFLFTTFLVIFILLSVDRDDDRKE